MCCFAENQEKLQIKLCKQRFCYFLDSQQKSYMYSARSLGSWERGGGEREISTPPSSSLSHLSRPPFFFDRSSPPHLTCSPPLSIRLSLLPLLGNGWQARLREERLPLFRHASLTPLASPKRQWLAG